MENQTGQELIDKIKNCHKKIQIKFSKDKFLSGLLHVKIEGNDERDNYIRGFASDTDPKMAIIKAYSEYIERLVFKKHSTVHVNIKSSNGFAAHTRLIDAQENSIKELIERDAFIASWLCYQPPHWLNAEEIEKAGCKQILEFAPSFKKHGLDYKIGIIGITNSTYYTVIGALIPYYSNLTAPKIGFAVDTCTHENLFIAISSIFQGISYYASLIVNRENAKVPLFNHINLEAVKKPSDHLEYYLNPKNMSCSRWFLSGSENILKLNLPSIQSESISIDIETAFPYFVTRAYSHFAQNYFVGKTDYKKINRSRITTIATKQNSINLDLHPLP